MSPDSSSNQTLDTNNSVEPENQHKSWWPLWLLGGLIILFLLMIIILRGLCSDVWYINLLQLNDKLCGGTSSLEQQLNLKDGSIRGPEIANGAVGFDQLNPEISAYLKTQINNTQNVTNNTNTNTTNNAGANYFYDLNCVSTVICNTSSVEANKNIAIQSAGTLTPTAQLRSGWGQLSDLLQFQGPAGNVQSVINTGGNFGIQTPAPMAALDVNGDAIIRNHAAIGPDATLGTGSLITPLAVGPSGIPILPATPIPANRTLAVQETLSGLPFSATPTAYAGSGTELYVTGDTDPGSAAITGSYSAGEIMIGNGYDYPALSGASSLAVHNGTGNITLGAGQWGGFYNMGSGDVTAAAGVNGTLANVGTGTMTYGYGLGSYMFNLGTGTVTNAGGLFVAGGQTGTGTIDNYTGVSINSPINTSTGTISNAIGLLVASQADTVGGGTDVAESINILSLDSAKYSKNILNGNNYFNAGINPDFRGDWQTNTATLPVGLEGHTAVHYNGYIYVAGGVDGTGTTRSEVYYAPVRANGSIGAWTTSANSLPVALQRHTSVVSNGYLYIIGGYDGTPFTSVSTVYSARINADGSLGAFSATSNPLPVGRRNHTSVLSNGYVYVLGGNTGFPSLDTVSYARLNADGSTSAWTTSGNLIPSVVSGHTSVVANGYVYIMSGSGTTAIYYAGLNDDGSIDPWVTNSSSTAFIQSRASAVVANGYIYNIAGRFFTAPGDQWKVPWHHRINSDGSIGPSTTDFFSLSDLPVTMDGQASVYVNGYIYTIGGSVATVPTDDIYYVSTRRNAFAGAVDLVGLSVTPVYSPGEQLTEDAVLDLVDITAGSQLTAGDISAFGNLEVNGSIFTNGGLTANGPINFGGETRLQNLTDSTNAFEVLDSSGASIINTDTTAGYVGITNATPAYNLHVGSSAIASGTTVARFENAGGTCDVTPNVVGAVTCTSDIRVKKNISEITDVLEKIGAISVYSYNLTAEKDDDPVHVGFLAQELEEIMPDLVLTDKNGMKSVSYAGLTPYLVQAIKQQQIQINELKNTSVGTSGGQTSVNVLAELASASAITINGDLIVNGKVEFSNSNKGTVKFKVAELKEKVLFSKQFTAIPNVVVSPNNFVTGAYKVSNVTKDSFEIELNQPQTEEVEFSWQAF